MNLHPKLHFVYTSHTSADVVSTRSCYSLSRTPDHPCNAFALAQDRVCVLKRLHKTSSHDNYELHHSYSRGSFGRVN